METWIASHFLNPAFVLGGAALVASPIIIHLINRMRYRRVQFAAMEFLLQSQRRNRRRILIEQLLLLLLRILIVLGIVALIARLVLDPSELSLFQGAQSHHVVVLDDSGSMRDQLGESTAWDASLEIVRKLVAEGSRRPGTQKFTLLTLSNPDQPLVTQRDVDETFLVELDGKLRNQKCTHQTLDLVKGLEGASNVLLEDRATVRHLHVISDYRQPDWQEQQSLAQIVKELDSAGVTINLVKTVGRRNGNLGITRLTGDLQVASVGVPVRFSLTIQNFSDQVATKVPVNIFQDGQKLPLTINFDRIEVGVAVDQEFDLTFDSPGRHRVDLRLGPDSLLADNDRFISVEVSPVNRVLIIEGNPANDDGEYLVDALAADPGITGYSAQLETVDYLRRRSIDEFQSVFMLNVSDLPADALAPLEEYVKTGGGLAWFLGDEIRPSFYISELYKGGAGLFPVKIGIVANQTQSSGDSDPDTEFSEHPIFGVFQGQENPFTELTRVFEYFPVSEDWEFDDQQRSDNVQTIARLTNRQPLAFTASYGKGTIFTCLTTCAPTWNNWARYPSFVPTMLDLEKFIARRDRILETRQSGEPIQLSLNPAEFLDEVEIFGPDDTDSPTRLKAAPANAASSGSDGATATSAATLPVRLQATYRDTDTPGIYRVRLLDQSQTPVERWITFNVPTEESDLSLATTELIRKQLGDNLEILIHEPGEFSWIAGRDAGQEVRFWLIVILFVILLAEQLLACKLSFHPKAATAGSNN
ncbi:MAG: BatA domain-containing protein [Planctomycetota bacterium]|nr:BatA domain-containing protein [Planctomycetota bacterium]MDA0917785.1 BatA domain-containing protein [Planctomycetota bacterium]MDA1159329.1 BatA domain-containing protein [Planctomycetota bacterium]